MFLSLMTLAHAGDLDFGYTPNPGPGEKPALFVTPARAADELVISCESGGRTYDKSLSGVSGGTRVTVEMARSASVTSAECYIRVRFADGYAEETTVPIEWAFAGKLSVDLSRASADVNEHTLTVQVTGPVDTATVVAFGAGHTELDRQVVEVNAGPGELTLPWAGDPGDVVLLDVKVENSMAWAGFTFSPWFLDIPHEDVLFESNSDVIDPDQEYKLEHTLSELNEVLEKYGDMVPVKLYVAGCTDTVGDAGHNRDLSQRRARSIAKWLRSHGFDAPIYYHGFGEGLLAVPTGDGVDSQANRRALYLVGSQPPPAGSGIPSVNWKPL